MGIHFGVNQPLHAAACLVFYIVFSLTQKSRKRASDCQIKMRCTRLIKGLTKKIFES